MKQLFSGPCPVCGDKQFTNIEVLWSELSTAWQLDQSEIAYINRQQGTSCRECGSNLRSMALAKAILDSAGSEHFLKDFCKKPPKGIRILEVNPAGNLTSVLQKIPGHTLISYPEYDLMDLPNTLGKYDFVIHSDTLEHIPAPVKALSECRRVLKPRGRCIFTVPIVIGRLSRSREGLPNSYHGSVDTREADYIVHTEFGSDVWLHVLQAGFSSCKFHCLEYPSAIAIEAAI